MFTHKMTGYADHTHETVADARACLADVQAEEAEACAEVMAERRNERFFEERGAGYAGSPEDARDRWLDSLIGL